MEFQIDTYELSGRKLACIEGCGYCCLCQAELLEGEAKDFLENPNLSKNTVLVSENVVEPAFCIKLQNDSGACSFLEKRKCQIYDSRPHFCRAYPVHLFSGSILQANANLSCRGLGKKGISLENALLENVDALGAGAVSKVHAETRTAWQEFRQEATASGAFLKPAHFRRAISDFLSKTSLEGVISSCFFIWGHKPPGGGNREQLSKCLQKYSRAGEDPTPAVEEWVLPIFLDENVVNLPVYIAPDSSWNVFRHKKGEILRYVLEEDGKLELKGSQALPELLPLDSAAQASAREYLSLWNRREVMLSAAAYMVEASGWEISIFQAYVGLLGQIATNLWWRASLLANVGGKTLLGAGEIMESIIFTDADFLDMDTLGVFV